jgi:hypothetical protein
MTQSPQEVQLFEFDYWCIVIGYMPFDLIRRPKGESDSQRMFGYWNLINGCFANMTHGRETHI